MNVFILDSDVVKYQGIYFVDSNRVVDFMQSFQGRPMQRTWTGDAELAFVPHRMPKGDTPGLFGCVPVFNVRAAQVLGDFLADHGEFLPVTIQGERYFLFNVTTVVDALDEANCDLERFDDGRLFQVHRYSFFPERLRGIPVFKIPQWPQYKVYCTDPFVERVKAAKLKGFKFPLLWSSDD